MTKQELLQNTELFLLDLDGTTYLLGTPIGNMVQTLTRLRELGKKIIFLTNSSARNEEEYVQLLLKSGIWDERDTVVSSAKVALYYVKKEFSGKRVHLIANDGVRNSFEEAGYTLTDENPDMCVLAIRHNITYDEIKAFNDNLQRGVPYIACNCDVNIPTATLPIPDVGAFIEFFRSSCGREPQVVCGKPSKVVADYVESISGVEKEKTCMVGDLLYTDIRFGNQNGIPTLLVLSGGTQEEDLANSMDKPNLVLPSLNELIEI